MAGRAVDTHLAAADRTDRVVVEADIEVAAEAAAMAAVGVMVAAVTLADITGRSIAARPPSPALNPHTNRAPV